jgi:hypothetical protein
MRVSIWQQFASNHSTDFTVVGKFASAEEAQQAASELRKALTAIHAWYREHPDVVEQAVKDYETPTPAEQHIGEQYSVEFTHACDWIAKDYRDDLPIDELVTTYTNIVFVTNRYRSTWVGGASVTPLMGKFTASIFVNEESGTAIAVTLTCRAPDQQTAVTIHDILQKYLKEGGPPPGMRPIPWIAYKTADTSDDGYHLVAKFPWGMLGDVMGQLEVNYEQLTVTNMSFTEIHYGLPAFIAWLTDYGCTDISYSLRDYRYE